MPSLSFLAVRLTMLLAFSPASGGAETATFAELPAEDAEQTATCELRPVNRLERDWVWSDIEASEVERHPTSSRGTTRSGFGTRCPQTTNHTASASLNCAHGASASSLVHQGIRLQI